MAKLISMLVSLSANPNILVTSGQGLGTWNPPKGISWPDLPPVAWPYALTGTETRNADKKAEIKYFAVLILG